MCKPIVNLLVTLCIDKLNQLNRLLYRSKNNNNTSIVWEGHLLDKFTETGLKFILSMFLICDYKRSIYNEAIVISIEIMS